ncbi:hypothetical protein ACFORH_39050 [Amycolatopsis roodepoortensis]|uniref:Uncharacterized protein n=1 Tax=Amycolatopsis roodepoortensis TaxID=700274 RepID=A0ABR9LJY1_9PSEU|nr:hypothetical protein [Amycolatopsis roodepoortensis]MBE1580513.1 hypothetical protein [Amycolatopsis roodepoortensis]
MTNDQERTGPHIVPTGWLMGFNVALSPSCAALHGFTLDRSDSGFPEWMNFLTTPLCLACPTCSLDQLATDVMQPASPAVDPLWKLLHFYSTITGGESGAVSEIWKDVPLSGGVELTEDQAEVFHTIASHKAHQAHHHATTVGIHDGSPYSRPLFLIDSGRNAGRKLAEEFGLPGHIADHSLYAVERAAVAALVLIDVKHGHIEVGKRFALARTSRHNMTRPSV